MALGGVDGLRKALMSEEFWRRKREVVERYDASASFYDGLYGEEQSKKFEAASESLLGLKSEAKLDLGCGTGLLLSRIWRRGDLIVAVDLSRNMLKRAVMRFGWLENVHFICGDADFLPINDCVFDRILSFTLLQNAPLPELTLKEVSRVAKKSSVLVFTGQKKCFSGEKFISLLSKQGLTIDCLFREGLKDYVAVCKRLNFYSNTE